jgi:3-oxoacyl-[acyl-carrier protein] reductase
MQEERHPMDVLVTGASGGIGRAVSELFLERGHRVDGIDVAPATVEHANYRHHVVDVRDTASLPDLSPQVIVTMRRRAGHPGRHRRQPEGCDQRV